MRRSSLLAHAHAFWLIGFVCKVHMQHKHGAVQAQIQNSLAGDAHVLIGCLPPDQLQACAPESSAPRACPTRHT